MMSEKLPPSGRKQYKKTRTITKENNNVASSVVFIICRNSLYAGFRQIVVYTVPFML